MESPVLVDVAAAADVPALVSLLDELFRIERDFVPDADKQARGLRLILDNPAIGQIFVVRMAAEVIGMASVLFTVSTAEGGLAAVLEDVVVAAPYRRRKIGRQLLRHALQWARERGALRVTLLADRGNEAALRFYASEGFAHSEAMTVCRHRLGRSSA